MIGPLAYIGGKNRLAAEIIRLLPPHTTYVEAFAGGAQVFFHKQPSEVEVLNDLDFEVVNFLRVCQWHHDELIRHMQFMLASRRLHELLSATSPDSLTDVQRAARFLYLQKNSFGGLVVRQKFNYGVIQNRNYNPVRLPESITNTHKRLLRAQIECLPYEQILERYDRGTTLFYLDPPYYGRKLYRHNFTDEQFVALAARLTRIAGKFLLSLDDHPRVREIFRAFRMRSTTLAYTALSKVGKRYPELLISNFELPQKAR